MSEAPLFDRQLLARLTKQMVEALDADTSKQIGMVAVIIELETQSPRLQVIGASIGPGDVASVLLSGLEAVSARKPTHVNVEPAN